MGWVVSMGRPCPSWLHCTLAVVSYFVSIAALRMKAVPWLQFLSGIMAVNGPMVVYLMTSPTTALWKGEEVWNCFRAGVKASFRLLIGLSSQQIWHRHAACGSSSLLLLSSSSSQSLQEQPIFVNALFFFFCLLHCSLTHSWEFSCSFLFFFLVATKLSYWNQYSTTFFFNPFSLSYNHIYFKALIIK